MQILQSRWQQNKGREGSSNKVGGGGSNSEGCDGRGGSREIREWKVACTTARPSCKKHHIRVLHRSSHTSGAAGPTHSELRLTTQCAMHTTCCTSPAFKAIELSVSTLCCMSHSVTICALSHTEPLSTHCHPLTHCLRSFTSCCQSQTVSLCLRSINLAVEAGQEEPPLPHCKRSCSVAAAVPSQCLWLSESLPAGPVRPTAGTHHLDQTLLTTL